MAPPAAAGQARPAPEAPPDGIAVFGPLREAEARIEDDGFASHAGGQRALQTGAELVGDFTPHRRVAGFAVHVTRTPASTRVPNGRLSAAKPQSLVRLSKSHPARNRIVVKLGKFSVAIGIHDLDIFGLRIELSI